MAQGEQTLDIQIPIGSDDRTYSFDLSVPATRVQELFLTPTPLLEGSVIQVEEEVQIDSLITNKSLIDADFRWFFKRSDIGSYQVAGEYLNRSFTFREELQGKILYAQCLIRAVTDYVVVPPAVDADLVWGIGRINACNFQLQGDIPGSSNPDREAVLSPKTSTDVLLLSQAVEIYPIERGDIRQVMQSLLLYYNPGAQPIQVSYRMRIGGQVQTLRPAFQAPGACLIQADGCTNVLNEFFANDPQIFRTRDEAVAQIVGLGASPATTAILIASIREDSELAGVDREGNPCIATYWSYVFI